MKHRARFILVFWHEHFDEVVAAIFVGELRAAGHKVRLVGVGAGRNRGKHGLRLVPDTTMSEALIFQAEVDMVVLPCDGWNDTVATHDPRLQELFLLLCHHDTRIIANPSVVCALKAWLPPSANQLFMAYPITEELVPFVRGLDLSL
jgi:hypothetical protein